MKGVSRTGKRRQAPRGSSRVKQLRRQVAIARATGVPVARVSPVFLRSQGELKGVDTELALTPVIATTNTNASSFVLNLVAPGTGSYNRVGRKIFNRNVRIFGHLEYTYSGVATTENLNGSTLRMVLVWDKQPSGVTPTFDTIFGSTTQDATESTDIFDPLKYDNMQRFRILKDVHITALINSQNTTGGTEDYIINNYYVDEFVDLKNRETTYSGQSSPCTIADISTGALFLFFRADQATANINAWTVASTCKSRLRYTD